MFEASASKAGRLQLEDFEDDLNQYQAAHFVFQGVPLVVQRHRGNPPNTYSIDVDFESARQRHVALSSVTRRIVHDLLELPDDAVIWSVGEVA